MFSLPIVNLNLAINVIQSIAVLGSAQDNSANCGQLKVALKVLSDNSILWVSGPSFMYRAC